MRAPLVATRPARPQPRRLGSLGCLCALIALATARARRMGARASPTASWARGSPSNCGPTMASRRTRRSTPCSTRCATSTRSMSTYKPTSEVSQVNAKAADGPMHISKELFDLLMTAKEYSVITDGAFDITYASVGYLYDFRKHVRPSEEQIGRALPAVNYRHLLLDPKNADRAVLAERRAHRSGRHRQGLLGRSRHRCAQVASASRGPTCRPAGTAASSATASASPGSSAFVIRGRERVRSCARAAGRCRDLDLRRLRAVLRRGRRALPPHHRSAHRPFGEQGAQRRPSSGPTPRAPTACRRRRSCSDPRKPWKSTIASTTSTPSSSSSTARWCIPKACSAREGRQPPKESQSLMSPPQTSTAPQPPPPQQP